MNNALAQQSSSGRLLPAPASSALLPLLSPMKVAAFISSYNDKNSLKRCIRSLFKQAYPVGEIIVVDNRSSDGTSLEVFPEKVTLICHLRNLGPTGAVATAFEYALVKNYDWMWILDQDSVAAENSLERLVKLYYDLVPEERAQIGILSSCIDTVFPGRVIDYFILTPKGPRAVRIDPDKAYCECDCTIWSGSLFNLEAVRKVGRPRFGVGGYWEDLSFDWGDIEFCYQVRKAGYKILVHQSSIIRHPIGRPGKGRLFGRVTITSNHPSFRRYLHFRNMVYFWCYLYLDRNVFFILLHICTRSMKDIVKIVMMEGERIPKIWAILRGIWDGLRKNLHHRFQR